MMILKFIQNTKVTHTFAGQCPVRPAVDDDFETDFALRFLPNVSVDYK